MVPEQSPSDEHTECSFLTDDALRRSGPKQILSSMLSNRCCLASGWTATAAEAKGTKQIGKGQCGEILALSGTTMVLKVPNEGKLEELWNNCCMHKCVEEAFQQTTLEIRKDINIPTFGNWIHPSNAAFWNILTQPSRGFVTYGLMSEKILPLPLPVRMAIVDEFAPKSVKENKEAFLSQKENEDCLIRLYLGRRVQRSNSKAFGLRNFDLTICEMEYIGLNTMMYARIIAQSLAVLHWEAQVDADDVEFVLGSAPKGRKALTAADLSTMSRDDAHFVGKSFDFGHRSVGIWLLDFNQCKRFPKDAAGVKQLQRAFFFNDPYYPRPGTKNAKDQALWGHFKRTYLKTSQYLTTGDMPMRFIEAVELESRERMLGGFLF